MNTPPAPERFTLPVPGGHVECALYAGDPGRPTLVLLHEGLGCVALWKDFPARLAAVSGAPVFAYSRLGYGGSAARPLPWPLDYMELEGTQGLPAVLAAAGIGNHVLLGHSDGATIALVHAGLARTAQTRGLILLAPHVFAEPVGLASIAQARRAFEQGDLRARLARHHGDNVDGAFRGWCEAWLHPDFERWNVEHVLPAIEVPLLQIQGEDDQYGSAAQLAAIARGVSGPCDTLLFAGCRHAPQFEQPVRTLEAIAGFMPGLAASP
jgi:pimeloyl-ACP methyl ester carboxylesterase